MKSSFHALFPPTFPWKLYLRFVGFQAVVLSLAFLALGRAPWIGLLLAGAFWIFSLWIARRIFHPLGRLIERARNRAEGPISDAEFMGNPVGELEDLESALNQIRVDLNRNTEELQREREELGVLMGSISDAILAIDAQSRVLFYNSRFAVLFKARDIDLKKSTLEEVFRVPEILEAFRSALVEKRSCETSMQLHPKNESGLRHFALSITPLRGESGKVYGAVAVFHDVTELKRAERLRIDFVANVSHELRTPLTAIKGFSDTLSSDLRENRMESVSRHMDVINRNVDRLMALVDDLLDLSSLDSGVELERAQVRTRDVTEKVLAQLEAKRAAKSLTVDTDFGTSAVAADPRRLEQVLVNLIDNAIKYVPRGGRIRIAWESSPETAGSAKPGVRLHVADNGPGIPADSLERLFERFYRVDKARSREIGGTGLGLAIVKHIMQRHGGSVSVVSAPGKGSKFVCDFPQG